MAADLDRVDLDYTSQAGLYDVDDAAPVEDERDISALRAINKMAKELRRTATSIETLDLTHDKLTVEQQLFAYQFALEFLKPLTETIDRAIDKVKNQGRG